MNKSKLSYKKMKIEKLWLGTFLLIISFINCTDKSVIFAKNIEKIIENLKLPDKTYELVSKFDNKMSIFFYTATEKELDELQSKFDLSKDIIKQIKLIKSSREVNVRPVKEEIHPNFFSYESSIGAALKEDDGRISFALIKLKSFANLKTRYDTHKERSCSGWWIFKSCYDTLVKTEKAITPAEKLILSKAVEYSTSKELKEAVSILKRGDFLIYMTDSVSMFSPDHKSVMHIAYFGNIAIGPTSELNSILPVNYKFSLNDKKGVRLIKQATGDVFQLRNYPTNEGISSDIEDFVTNKGQFHKFNFLIKNKIKKFPGEYLPYMSGAAFNGPYVFELKKNGNLIFYQKSSNPFGAQTYWSSNTANKGTFPYNLYLTNDRKLVLKDAKGLIIYQSNGFVETPTVYYGNSGQYGSFSYNGFLANTNRYSYLNPNTFYLKTDNKNFNIEYEIRDKSNGRKFTYYTNNNDVYSRNRIIKKGTSIDYFKAKIISGNNNFDLCYTAKLDYGKWTKIGCNGDVVGYLHNSKNDSRSIKDLIIYVKEKSESIPDISSLPKALPLFKTIIELNKRDIK